MRSQSDGKMKCILHVKDYFSKCTTLYSMLNKKVSTVAQFLYMFILHCGILDIIQCDNGTEFTGAVIFFLSRYRIKIINGRPRASRTQGLVEQANGVAKNDFKKKIKATRTIKWSKHLIGAVLAMNTQEHSCLLYNITPYEVFFGLKYWDRDNSLVTLSEVGLGPVNITDEWKNNIVKERFFLIDEVVTKFFEDEKN